MRARNAFLVGVLVVGLTGCSEGPSQFTLRMSPRPPLSPSQCLMELEGYGFSPMAASVSCQHGMARPWYHGVLVNAGQGAYPACEARAYDRSGKKLFEGGLSLAFGGFPGLYADAHSTTEFDWYLPVRLPTEVARYGAACGVNKHPPI